VKNGSGEFWELRIVNEYGISMEEMAGSGPTW